jgi:hypothetical protein
MKNLLTIIVLGALLSSCSMLQKLTKSDKPEKKSQPEMSQMEKEAIVQKEMIRIEKKLEAQVNQRLSSAIEKIEKENIQKTLEEYKMQMREAIATELADLTVSLEEKIKTELMSPKFLPELEQMVVEQITNTVDGKIDEQYDDHKQELIDTAAKQVMKKVLDSNVGSSKIEEVVE